MIFASIDASSFALRLVFYLNQTQSQPKIVATEGEHPTSAKILNARQDRGGHRTQMGKVYALAENPIPICLSSLTSTRKLATDALFSVARFRATFSLDNRGQPT